MKDYTGLSILELAKESNKLQRKGMSVMPVDTPEKAAILQDVVDNIEAINRELDRHTDDLDIINAKLDKMLKE